MFIDEAEITVKAGDGGPGKVSFYHPPMRGPDGGNGGNGGNIFVEATSDLSALGQFSGSKVFSAGNGQAGGGNRKFGRYGQDKSLVFPIGSLLKDEETGEVFGLDTLSQQILLCRGGQGGKGNYQFKSSRRTTPDFAQPGTKGQARHLKVILQLIADFGLIGLPNAGKSSLLNELTRANVKVGNYAFTTTEPSLGSVGGKVLADIPGLIAGASRGKGLGVKFLKHIEKVSLLLHCVSAESSDVKRDYDTLMDELRRYNPALIDKPQLIALTKSDLVDPKTLTGQISELKQTRKPVLSVSIYNWESLEKLRRQLGIL